MGRKNIIFNDYISQNERFADFFNGILFKGRKVVCPDALTALDTKAWRRMGEKNSFHEYVRDHLKRWDYQGRQLILGIEPEEAVHFALPVKYMNYESIQYDKNYKHVMKGHREKKDLDSEEYISGFSVTDRLIPVISIGIYLGKKKWPAPVTLHQMLGMEEFPEEVKNAIMPYCNDFRSNLLDINSMKTSDVFETDLREVFGFLMRQNDKMALKKYVDGNRRFRYLREDAFDVIQAYSGSLELEVRKEEYRAEEGFDMCLAIKELIEDGKAEGKAEAFEVMNELIRQLIEDGRTEDLLRSSRDFALQKRLIEEYGISNA